MAPTCDVSRVDSTPSILSQTVREILPLDSKDRATLFIFISSSPFVPWDRVRKVVLSGKTRGM